MECSAADAYEFIWNLRADSRAVKHKPEVASMNDLFTNQNVTQCEPVTVDGKIKR